MRNKWSCFFPMNSMHNILLVTWSPRAFVFCYRLQMKLHEGNVFTRVCYSVHGRWRGHAWLGRVCMALHPSYWNADLLEVCTVHRNIPCLNPKKVIIPCPEIQKWIDCALVSKNDYDSYYHAKFETKQESIPVGCVPPAFLVPGGDYIILPQTSFSGSKMLEEVIAVWISIFSKRKRLITFFR